jgi:ubiquinone/menaquinone biosynthesis C-methylase UbiE
MTNYPYTGIFWAGIMTDDSDELKKRYDNFARSRDVTTTASDFHLRDLEIDFGLEHIRDGDRILDVGCGPAVALVAYASQRKIEASGIDYAENMVAFAQENVAKSALGKNINIQHASVMELPFGSNSFDVVTSHRCLMALLDWERQKSALMEIHRVLKPGGMLVLMEGTHDGIERLNNWRQRFDLPEIDPAGRDRLITLKFREKELLDFTSDHYQLQRIQRWGMYYFLTRIVQPLLVSPEQPSYSHRLNEVAKQIARFIPDLNELGHLVGFAFRKK